MNGDHGDRSRRGWERRTIVGRQFSIIVILRSLNESTGTFTVLAVYVADVGLTLVLFCFLGVIVLHLRKLSQPRINKGQIDDNCIYQSVSVDNF